MSGKRRAVPEYFFPDMKKTPDPLTLINR